MQESEIAYIDKV